MKGKFAAVLTALSLFVQLSNIRFAFAEIIHTSENALPQQIMNSVSASHSLDLISFSPVVADGKTLGALLVYDDLRTKRPDDYLELYDNGAHLVAVGWYDQFGIQRFAVDRGLFEPGYALSGIFVTLLSGDAI